MTTICKVCGIVTEFVYLLPDGDVVGACSAAHAGGGGRLVDWNKFDGEEYRGRSMAKLVEEAAKDGKGKKD